MLDLAENKLKNSRLTDDEPSTAEKPFWILTLL